MSSKHKNTLVRDEISSYLNLKEISGALLIKGKWGSGKTYQVKKTINDYELGKKYNFLLCSFFGVSDIENASKIIKSKYAFGDFSKSKLAGIIGAVKNITSKFFYGDVINSVLSINIYDFINVERISDGKETVIIIDDLERSEINCSELLGLVNDFCENKKIKTIIIANEDEIIKKDKYKSFKEKVIYRTIHIVNDNEDIIESVISNYNETTKGYKDFLENNKQVLLDAFVESETENIRLLKSCLIDFERFYSIFVNKINQKNKKLGEILYSFCAYKIEAGLGKIKNGDLGEIVLEDERKYKKLNKCLSFDTLVTWAVEGKWNEINIKEEIEDRFTDKTLSSDEKILHYDIWDLDSKTLESGIPVILQRGYAGELSCNQLIRFLSFINVLNKLNILNELNESLSETIDFCKLFDGWMKREQNIKEGQLEEENRRYYVHNSNELEKIDVVALKLYQRLENFDNLSIFYENRLSILNLIKGTCSDCLINIKVKPIPCFDRELANAFIDSYLKADNSCKNDLSILISNIELGYSGSSNKEDITESILNLKDVCNKFGEAIKNSEDYFDKCCILHCIETINKKIDELENIVKG